MRRVVALSRRDYHAHVSKRNCTWRPSGHGPGYEEVYVEAVLTHDRRQVRMCLTKDRYPSPEFAATTVERRTTISGKLLRVYRCDYCRGYHLTSQPQAELPAAA